MTLSSLIREYILIHSRVFPSNWDTIHIRKTIRNFTEDNTIFLALYYIKKSKVKDQIYLLDLWISAIICANIYISDYPYSLKAWSKIVNKTENDLYNLVITFLQSIDYTLYCIPENLETFKIEIKSHTTNQMKPTKCQTFVSTDFSLPLNVLSKINYADIVIIHGIPHIFNGTRIEPFDNKHSSGNEVVPVQFLDFPLGYWKQHTDYQPLTLCNVHASNNTFKALYLGKPITIIAKTLADIKNTLYFKVIDETTIKCSLDDE